MRDSVRDLSRWRRMVSATLLNLIQLEVNATRYFRRQQLRWANLGITFKSSTGPHIHFTYSQDGPPVMLGIVIA